MFIVYPNSLIPNPRALTWSLCSLAIVCSGAWAQDASRVPQQVDISRQRVPQPLPNTPAFDLRIQSPEKSAIPKAVDELLFNIQRIDVQGATLMDAGEVNQYFASIIGTQVDLQTLRDAADRLEAAYRNKGYFLTRVFIPPQQVKDGVFKVRVVEGYISKVNIDGGDPALRDRVMRMSAGLTDQRPIGLKSLERVLLMINDLPGVAAAGVLAQGQELGASELMITVTDAPAMQTVSLANTNSNITGPWVLSYNGTFNRPFGSISAINLGATGAGGDLEEVRSFTARYIQPVGYSGLLFSLGALVGDARPGGAVRAIGIESHSTSFTPRLRYPLMRTRANSVFIDSGIALNHAKTTVAGSLLTEDKTTVGDITLSWVQNGWLNGSTSSTFALSQGLPWFGAMDRSTAAPTVAAFNPSFRKYTATVLRNQPITAQWSAQCVISGQYTEDKLISGELVTFGGPFIGRAYDPSAIAGDRGVGAQLELRYDTPLPLDWVKSIQLYGFVDNASVTSLGTASTSAVRASLASTGLGVRFPVDDRFFVDTQLAKARRQFNTADARYDPRLLINLSARF